MCLQTSLKPFIFLCLCPLEQGLHFFTVFPRVSSFEKTQKGLFLRCGCGNTLLTLLKTPPHTLPFPPPPIRSNLGTTVTLGKWQGKCYIQGDRYFKASQLCRKYNATENFGKLSSDRNIQCDRQILYFYSSLHSWRLFVEPGRVKRQIHETELQNFWLFPPHSPCCSTGLSLRDALAAGRILKNPFSPCPRAC